MGGVLTRLAGLRVTLHVLSLLILSSAVFAAEGDLTVTVKSGDTLSKIASRTVGLQQRRVWQEIAAYNNLDPKQPLKIGAIILIPSSLLAQRVVGKEQVNWNIQSSVVSQASIPTSPVSQASVPTSPVSESVVEMEESGTPGAAPSIAPQDADFDGLDTRPCLALDNCIDDTIDERETVSPAGFVEPSKPSVQTPSDTAVLEPTEGGSNNAIAVSQENQDSGDEIGDVESSSGVSVSSEIAEDADVNPQQPDQDDDSRLPGLFDVDEDAAVRALERSLVQLDALLLEKGSIELGLDYTFSFNSSLEPVLILPSDTAEDDSDVTPALAIFEDSESQQFIVLDFKVGLPGDAQLSVALPFEMLESKTAARVTGVSVDSDSQTLEAVGDYSIGFSKALFYEKGRLPDLLFRIGYDGDSGRESGGLRTGSGANELTVGLSATKRQDPLVFTLAASHTIADEVDDFEAGAVTGISVGTLLAASPFTSLLLEFDQVFIGEASIDGASLADTDTSIGSLLVGASSVLGQSLFLSAGLRLGLTEAATDYQFSIGLSKRL